MKRLLHLLAAGGLGLGGVLAAAAPAAADVPAGVAAYGSFAYATGVHVIVYTDAYPNFSSGAVDNHYPLARVRQDGSPLADATATYSDVGPGVQTVTACSGDPSQCGNRPGVPYANAHYPGGKAKDHVDTCTPSGSGCSAGSPPAAYADTAAEELAASASGVYAGGGSQPFSGAEADSHTSVRADGSLALTTHSAIQSATFAGGQIQISKVEVTTIVGSAAGRATGDSHVTVGQVLINGQPASITDQGVTVQQSQVVACSAAPALPPPLGTGSAAPACVPQVDTETFKVFTVAGQKKVSGSHATVSAGGLHVLVTQPSTVPGAPAQRVEYVFGEGYADGELTTGGDAGSAADTSGGDMGTLVDTGTSGFGSADAGTADLGTADLGAPAALTAPAAHHVAALLSANRRPLALLFLCWESLLLAAAAAYVWARRVRLRLAAAPEDS